MRMIRMIDVFRDKIIKHIRRRDYRPVKLAQLAKALGVEQGDYAEFKKAFDELRDAGQVVIGSGNAVQLPAITSRLIGRFRANPKGFGFVVPLEPNTYGDLFVPAPDTAGAMTSCKRSLSCTPARTKSPRSVRCARWDATGPSPG